MTFQADPPQADAAETVSLPDPVSGTEPGSALPHGEAVFRPPNSVLTVDVLDEASGMAEVEDDQGRSFEVPAAWLPGAAEGLAYRVTPHPGGVHFSLLPGGSRDLRERSKQTLLEFSDEHEDGDAAHAGDGTSDRDRT